jgi:hypothetical protein
MMLKLLISVVNFEVLNLLPFYDGLLDWISGTKENQESEAKNNTEKRYLENNDYYKESDERAIPS